MCSSEVAVAGDSGRGIPALVAHGNRDSRASIGGLLARVGCSAHSAASGEEAMDVANAVLPVLAVLDVEIPGITAYEVCRELADTFGDDVGSSSFPNNASRTSTESPVC
jgi:CheY-like chemotaxis protein